MRYVYLVTHDYDYEGHSVVSVETSAKKAIQIAENHLGGDWTTVSQYLIGHGEYESKMVAKWKHQRSNKFKRIT